MDLFSSDVSIGILFAVLSMLLVILTVELMHQKNNWWWAFAGLIPSAAIAVAAFTNNLDLSYRYILLAFWIFSFLHVAWNLYRNLRKPGGQRK